MDEGAACMVDPRELARVRRQARSVHARALALTLVLTIGALVLPR